MHQQTWRRVRDWERTHAACIGTICDGDGLAPRIGRVEELHGRNARPCNLRISQFGM
jgi:hypothetical protein